MASVYKVDSLIDILNSIHPKQLIRECDEVKLSIHKVRYKYKTIRGNEKQGEKYFILNSINPQYDTKEKLNKWVSEYNHLNKHRQISNVEFLDSLCLGYICI